MDFRNSQGESLFNPLSPPNLTVSPRRTPHCAPLSFEPAIAGVEPLDELNAPKSCLPLTLYCTICLRTSTWYKPMHQNFKQSPPLDILPSLSISSHSTSSEPSSIGTEFFSNVVMSPSRDSLCAPRVLANFEDSPLIAHGSDDHTPVAMSEKSAVSDRQASSRINSWIGGGLQGICSSCHHSSPIGTLPLSPILQLTTGRITTKPSKPPSYPSSTPINTSVKVLHDNEPDMPSSRLDGVKGAIASPAFATSIYSSEKVTTPSDTRVLPSLPLKTGSFVPESTKRSASVRTRQQSSPVIVKDLQTITMPAEHVNKSEAIAPDSSYSVRHEVNRRGTTLRALLREAKIPQSDSDGLNNPGRRPPTTVEKWQAAMIATPRDHLRQGDFPTWQQYGATDSPFYQHLCGLSASTSSLSGKGTLISASVTSFRNSPYEDSRSCSPASEQLMKSEAALLKRRPSQGRQEISEVMPNSTSSEFPLSSSDTGRYLSAPSLNETQEILSGSALAKVTRHSPSNISLISRLANIHPNPSKVGRGYKRRPNTATGTTQSSSITQSSPKPGSRGRSTPSPNTAGASLLPSLFLAGSKATSAESRITNVMATKRPATATCSGSQPELTFPVSKDHLVTRPLPIERPALAKNSTTFFATLAPIQSRVTRNDTTDVMGDRHQIPVSVLELDNRLPKDLSRDSLSSTKLSPVLASPKSNVQFHQGSPVQLSQSVPNFLPKPRFPTPKRNPFYASATLAFTPDQLTDTDLKVSNLESSPWLQHEDFQSKSRNFILSVLPRPTISTFNPGQKLSVHLKLSNKAKVRKYTSIYLLLVGNIICNSAPQASTHNFLRHNYLIYPNPSEEVKIISNSGDLSEWHLELYLPEYANCPCTPGPLPLPSTGTHAAGAVSYHLQLYADRKQLLSNQESLSVKMNVMTRAEARFQVTTQCFKTTARKGRIPFSGGYLGSIDELSLSHQVYYQSADRLRIGYQFELQLSPNFFLPSSVAEEVSRATIIQVHTMMRLQPNDCALKFTDHRSKVTVIPPDEKGSYGKWIIKGFLEMKAVSQQLKAVKAALDCNPRTPRRAENTMSSRSMLSSSQGNNSLGGGLTSPLNFSINNSLQNETERQAKFNSSQLFLMANIDHCPGVLTKPVEISSLIGPELLSPCSLRKLGDEMMKKAVMAEKMKRVQEENFKNDH